MALALEEANRVIQVAIAKANELNVKVSVPICDAGGRLVVSSTRQNRLIVRLADDLPPFHAHP